MDGKEDPLYFRSPSGEWGGHPQDFVRDFVGVDEGAPVSSREWPDAPCFRNPVSGSGAKFCKNPINDDFLRPLFDYTTTDLRSLRNVVGVDPETGPHFSRNNVGVQDDRSTNSGVNAALQSCFSGKSTSSNPDRFRREDTRVDLNLPRNLESNSGGKNYSSLCKNPVGNAARSSADFFANPSSNDRVYDPILSQNPLEKEIRDPKFLKNTRGKNARSDPEFFRNSASTNGSIHLDFFRNPISSNGRSEIDLLRNPATTNRRNDVNSSRNPADNDANPELSSNPFGVESRPCFRRNPRARRVDNQDFSTNPVLVDSRDPEHGTLPQKRSIAESKSDSNFAKRKKF
eukprot:TRINITY_DN18492_c0_g2_i3.p1 TRINITY_DN18492_c0_g2~~TRINITY_DN18492_c0_g2_i3.p1  ORF type:complete len:344 (+),score=66.96 TRINITY_DN18492_c0_g2_i3:693-1724(+)